MKRLLIHFLLFALAAFATPSIGTSNPSSGTFLPSTWYTYTFTAYESTGYQNMLEVRYLWDIGPSGVNACYIQIKPNSNQMYLLNDAGTIWGTALTPGSGSTLTNSQCSIRGTGASISNSGTTVTTTVSVNFAPTYYGNRYLWIWCANVFGQNTSGAGGAWPATGNAGTVRLDAPPALINSTGLPANFNVGVEYTITATVRDPDGYADISYYHLLLNYAVDGGWACYFMIAPNGNYFQLLNDAASAWGPAYTFGVAGTAANSSCRVNAATSSRSISGTDATATLKITFLPGVFTRGGRTPAITGSYLYAVDVPGVLVGWSGVIQTGTARTGPKLLVDSIH